MHGNKQNLINHRFGRLVVVASAESDKRGHARWLCQCDCGNQKVVSATSLKTGQTKSCGCYHEEKMQEREYKYNDLKNQKFNMLTAIEIVGKTEKKGMIWKCICDCGNYTEVAGTLLSHGKIKSCGCLRKVTGEANGSFKHGMRNTKLYNSWVAMKKRCLNKADEHYPNYGGRGITVCPEWMEFDSFYEWAMSSNYKDGLTIERIDVNGNYEPSNCKWATAKEQADNRRTTVHITVDGVTKNATDWAKTLGVGRSTIGRHITKGDIEEYISSRL